MPKLYASVIVLMLYAVSTFAWKWGSEGTGSEWFMPEGLCGCKWLNYRDGWMMDGIPIKFINWTAERPNQYPICWEGAVATIMMYQEWPNKTYMDGNWNNSETVRIEHTWDYLSLKNSICATGDPTIEPTSNNIPGYSMVSHEIGRLYSAALVAYNSGYLFDGSQRLFHIIKNRLGFANAQYIFATDNNAINVVKTELQQGRPVIVLGDGHTWNIDGYRSSDQSYHILDAAYNLDIPWNSSKWTTDPKKNVKEYNHAVYFIYSLDPLMQISNNTSKCFSFSYGDQFIGGTSNTSTNKRIRFKNFGTPLGKVFKVTIRDDNKTYYMDYPLCFKSVAQEVTLPSFNFAVPQTSNTLNVIIQNLTGGDFKAKMVIDDYAGDPGSPKFFPGLSTIVNMILNE